ncbi:MAG: hypothetical protein LQ340_000882 [Diploschistes diacapsis]|nr:MAG: hypothetical protein LQ340_000882 [Diploschistes diacapsis]
MALHDFFFTPWALLFLPILYYVLPYLRNWSIRSIPGPPGAAFSNLWLLYQSRLGRRYLSVDRAHKKYGTFVRIQPDHVSIASPDAIPIIYGHGNGFLKAQYYDAFVSIQRGLFNTRDRHEHSRKRKMVSHTFSARSVGEFEQYVRSNLSDLVRQWNGLSEAAAQRGSRWAAIDSLQWFNYLAFDIIGDLAFGAPFGMVNAGADIAEVRETPSSPPRYAAAVQVLNRRGEVSNTLGSLPALKPYAAYIPDPFFSRGLRAVHDLAGIAVARVGARLEQESSGTKSPRRDLLARLMEGRDEHGQPMGRAELTAEALTQLIAGSDTTSNTSCAFFFWATRTAGVYARLRAELDAAAPGRGIPSYGLVKDLPYLGRAIREALRVHSTSSLGLPRVVPPGRPVDVLGRSFPPGTVLSVPSYTVHHDEDIWGPDALQFDPDRWQEGRLTERQRNAFVPFSYGPRACVGRNVAEMELALIVATVVLNFDLELRQDSLETREGFLRKPLGCAMGLRKRG